MNTTAKIINDIATVIGNPLIAAAIHDAVTSALGCRSVHLAAGQDVQGVFEQSLKAAIRDIENHPKGELFQRLIEYGPPNPDEPEALSIDGKTTLSDPECGTCVEFIFSHMVNRFKGELAELLALQPCMALLRELQEDGRLPVDADLYWGEAVQERGRAKGKNIGEGEKWGGFVKGADGLIAHCTPPQGTGAAGAVQVHGVIEIKSMPLPEAELVKQIHSHINRLHGGVKLGQDEFPTESVSIRVDDVVRVMVVPSTWKLSRDWHIEPGEHGETQMLFREPSDPPPPPKPEEVKTKLWKLTLDWSAEALEQAAYEMTFWYMSQVGANIYAHKSRPKGWEYMTPEQAGYNAIKMMLYYMPLRYLSKRQHRLAVRLYNVYSFGYPLGVDSDDMLWGPLLAVFWIHRGRIFALDKPAGEIREEDGIKRYPFCHDEKWQDLRRAHPELADERPWDRPPARVEYASVPGNYRVYLPPTHCGRKSLLARIIQQFQLPPSQTVVVADPQRAGSKVEVHDQ